MSAAPRIAFLFHSAQQTGASLWLQRLLESGAFDPARCIAALPGESPIAEALRWAGIVSEIVPVAERSFRDVGAAGAFALLRSRRASALAFRDFFARHRPAVAYVNSGVQVLGGVAAKRAGCLVLWHIHEGWGSGPIFAWKRRTIIRTADAIVFAARAAERLFDCRLGTLSQPRLVSPNGVDPALTSLRERREELRRKFGLSPEDRVALFAGAVTQRKGAHDLLGAWPAVLAAEPRARLLLAGPREENETHPLLRGDLCGAAPRVEYLGFRNDVPELMAAADLYVLPSHAEAMPIGISEALMVGVPVLARGVGDVPWMLEEGRGRLIEGPPRELAPQIVEALRWAEIADPGAGQRFARERLSWPVQCRQIRDAVELLCSNRGGDSLDA